MDGGNEDGANFDPCECVWSHELATRRLINLIRNNQDYCAENECYTELTGGTNPEYPTTAFFIGFWFIMAIMFFLFRPNATVSTNKSRDNNGPNYEPPTPPAML